MKTAVARPSHRLAEPAEAVLADAGGRLAAYLALTKPRIGVMVLVTVATGFLLGARGRRTRRRCSLTLLGTGLVAGGRERLEPVSGAGARRRMRRTANRPLPSGRLRAGRGGGVRRRC